MFFQSEVMNLSYWSHLILEAFLFLQLSFEFKKSWETEKVVTSILNLSKTKQSIQIYYVSEKVSSFLIVVHIRLLFQILNTGSLGTSNIYKENFDKKV